MSSTLSLRIELDRPHGQQSAFMRSPAKRKVIRAGRRSGKTTGIAIFAAEQFLAGRRILYATPTTEQIDRFWSLVTRYLQPAIDAGIYAKNETRHIIERSGTEQRIRAKTAWNADSLRGDYADLLILDEYQLMDETAWAEVGAPMMLDSNGSAVFIYTPPSIRSRSVSKAQDKRHAAKFFKAAQADDSGRWATFHFSSHDNPYISRDALDDIAQDMTALAYRQEILAEDIEEVPGALWSMGLLDKTRVANAPELRQVVVGVDPKTEETADSETGIVVAGMGVDSHIYILADYSRNASPEGWAQAVAFAYHTEEANTVIAERNQGGDMVRSVLAAADEEMPVRMVRATRGKWTRAEPVAARWEKEKIHIVGDWPLLEEQMVTWVPGDKSPDRLDAMVWAVTALLGNTTNAARMAQL